MVIEVFKISPPSGDFNLSQSLLIVLLNFLESMVDMGGNEGSNGYNGGDFPVNPLIDEGKVAETPREVQTAMEGPSSANGSNREGSRGDKEASTGGNGVSQAVMGGEN